AVMAEHTAIRDLAAESGMLGKIVSGAHSPMPAALGIPGQRQLDQVAGHRAADVAARVAAGSEPVINVPFHNVRRLPAPQNWLSVAREHGKAFVRGFMLKAAALQPSDLAERPRHPCTAISFCDR